MTLILVMTFTSGISMKDVTVIACNAKAYDVCFIYGYLIQSSIIPEPTILLGSKTMFMTVEKGMNIRLTD